jgi:integral membrane protein (TIGR00529 family)
MKDLIFLVVSLLLIGVLVQLKISIAISVFLLAIITAIFKGLGVIYIIHLLTRTLTRMDTINMILVIIIVTYLGEVLKTSGLLSDISSTFKKIFSPKIYLPLYALVIGLLPMPGGALVSAPMVEEGAQDVEINQEEKALLNFWFRHVWEPISPLYPEFLLGVSILGTTIGKVISIQWPLSLGMLLSGILFVIPLIKSETRPTDGVNFQILINILRSLSPIIFIFIILMSFKNLPSFVAMLSGLIYLIIMKRVTLSKLKSSFKFKKIIEYTFLIYSIFFLREIITSTNFALSVYNELQILKAPTFLILFLLPFSIGFLAGISSASIGIAYPLLMPLLKSNGALNSSNVLIAYLGVWTALLFTPMHLCLSLSVDYFKTNFTKVYKLMLKPFLLLLILTSIWIVFLKFKP